MNDNHTTGKDKLEKIIKEGVEMELGNYDFESVSDEEMIRSGQVPPPEEILEKILEKTKSEKNKKN